MCLHTYVHKEVKTACDQERGTEKNIEEVAEEAVSGEGNIGRNQRDAVIEEEDIRGDSEDAAFEEEYVGGEPEDAAIEGEDGRGSEDADSTKLGGDSVRRSHKNDFWLNEAPFAQITIRPAKPVLSALPPFRVSKRDDPALQPAWASAVTERTGQGGSIFYYSERSTI
ncbi:hypothetical protein NDU88_002089 [Pleurodeles waltl]|uniref:Uncharacterized protein n=1 Tax=Pleurodeles waltl TaxID=8319 RepID=A0AAV7NL15_PLEWA|nr:hypothetical protein NDU88_002089 [Pleurodeles waltl]